MILLLVDITAVPGKRDEYVRRLHDVFTSGADGLLQYAIGTTASEPDAITIVEEWHDDETQARFMQTETFATFRSATDALRVGEPAARRFTIDVPRAPEPPVISLL